MKGHDQDGVTLLADRNSAGYLHHLDVDYSDDLVSMGFRGRRKRSAGCRVASPVAGAASLQRYGGITILHRDCRDAESHVLAIAARQDGDTYRAVYTVQFEAAVYVLHAFQKKAKRGIATPKQEIDLIRRRLKAAKQHYAGSYKEG